MLHCAIGVHTETMRAHNVSQVNSSRDFNLTNCALRLRIATQQPYAHVVVVGRLSSLARSLACICVYINLRAGERIYVAASSLAIEFGFEF